MITMPEDILIEVPLSLIRRAAKTDRNFMRILARYHKSKVVVEEIKEVKKPKIGGKK
jgi:hypothetical protein